MTSNKLTNKEIHDIELREYEILSRFYGKTIEDANRGIPIDSINILLAEKRCLDNVYEALKKRQQSKEYLKYMNNPILVSMAKDIMNGIYI